MRRNLLHIGGWADGEWLKVEESAQYVKQTNPKHPEQENTYRRSQWSAGHDVYVIFAEESLDATDVFELLVTKYTNAHRC
jgi:hypothetical protein